MIYNNKVSTEKVQLWNNGIMLTAQLSNQEANCGLRSGRYLKITDQAVRFNPDFNYD